jgi:membrane associated rhomboid family serine protease
VIPSRPYSFTEDIRRALRVPPPATLVLFLVTVVVFIGQTLGGSEDWQRAVGLIPANVANASSLLPVGNTQIIQAWLTLFAYMFLHGGVYHLLANMACLWLFGMIAEPVMGTRLFSASYVAFGLITGLAIVAIIPHWTAPMVGASGAVSGVLGAFLALEYSARIGRGGKHIAILLVEALVLLLVGAWFITRKLPSEPDRASAVAWHLIPLLAAWYGMRAWKALSRHCRTRRSR